MVTYMFKFEKKGGGGYEHPPPHPGSDVYGSKELNIAKRYDLIMFNHTFINNNTRHNCNIVSLTNRSQDVYGVTSVDHMTVFWDDFLYSDGSSWSITSLRLYT